MSSVDLYKDLRRAHEKCVNDLGEFALTLLGLTILFRRGKQQVVLAEVIGAKGTVLTIRNVESDRTYFIDLCVTEIEQIQQPCSSVTNP